MSCLIPQSSLPFRSKEGHLFYQSLLVASLVFSSQGNELLCRGLGICLPQPVFSAVSTFWLPTKQNLGTQQKIIQWFFASAQWILALISTIGKISPPLSFHLRISYLSTRLKGYLCSECALFFDEATIMKSTQSVHHISRVGCSTTSFISTLKRTSLE